MIKKYTKVIQDDTVVFRYTNVYGVWMEKELHWGLAEEFENQLYNDGFEQVR